MNQAFEYLPRRISSVTLLGCLVWLAGCGGKVHDVAAGSGSFAYGRTTVTYGTWGDGTAVLVWSDTDGPGGGVANSSPEGARYRGRARASDDRLVEWECSTTDGKTGPVTINGETYELSSGPLFLVTTRGGKTEVQQLHRSLANI